MGEPSRATYPSRYSPGKNVTPEQWLAEFACGRQAAAKGLDLPPRFWAAPGWKETWEKAFRRQLMAARTLLKLYSPQAVSAALRGREGRRVVSLAAPWLDDLVKAEQARLDREGAAAREREASRPPPPPPPPSTGKTAFDRPAFTPKKSVLDKLQDLEE